MDDLLGAADIESLSLDDLHARIASGAGFSVTEPEAAEEESRPDSETRGAGAGEAEGNAAEREGVVEGADSGSSADETPTPTLEERIALLERQNASYRGQIDNQRNQYQAERTTLQQELDRLRQAETTRAAQERQQVQTWIDSLPDEAQRAQAQNAFDRRQIEQDRAAFQAQVEQYQAVAGARELEQARRELTPYFGQYADYVAQQLALDPADVRDVLDTEAFANVAATFAGPQDLVKIGGMIEAHARAVQASQSRRRADNRAAAKAEGAHQDVGRSGTGGSPSWVDRLNAMSDDDFLKFQDTVHNNGGRFPKA